MAASRSGLLRALRRLAGWSLALLAVAALALAAGAWAISTGVGRPALRGWLEGTLARALDARVAIGGLDGPLYPTFTLRDVRIARPDGTELSLDHARVRVGLGSLLWRRELVVHTVDARGLDVRAPRLEETGAGKAVAAPRPAAPLPISVAILRLELRDGRFDVAWQRARCGGRLAGRVGLSVRGLEVASAGAIPWPEQGTLSVVLERSQLAGRALRSGELELELRGTRLRLLSGRLAGDLGEVELEGAADLDGWLEPGAPAAATWRARLAALDIAAVLPVAGVAGRVSGSVDGSVERAAGAPLERSRIRARLDLGARDGRWGTAAAAQLSAKGELAGSLEDPSGALSLTARELTLGPRRLGALAARVSSAGGGRVVLEELALRGGDLTLSAARPATLVVDRDGVAVERLELALDRGTLAADGRLGREGPRELRVESKGLDLAALGALLPGVPSLGGVLTAELVADGPWPLPALRGAGVWGAPRYGELRAQELRFETRVEGALLRASLRVAGLGPEPLTVRATLPYRAEAVGLDELLAAAELRVELRTAGLGADRLAALTSAPLGWLEQVEALRLELVGGAPVPILEGQLRWRDGGTLELRGGVGRRGFRGFELRARELPVDVIARELAGAAEPGGRLSGTALLDGAWRSPRLDAELEWLEPRLRGVEAEAARAEVASGEGRVRLALRVIREARDVLTLRASLPRPAAPFEPLALLRDPSSEVTLRGDALELAWLAALLPDRTGATSGRLDLAGELRGASPWPSLVGSLHLDGVESAHPMSGDVLAPLAASAELRTHGARTELRVGLEREAREVLVAEASLPHPLDGPAWSEVLVRAENELRVRGDALELSWLAPLLPPAARRVVGRLELDAHARGAAGLPELSGEVRLTEGGLWVPVLRQWLRPIEGRATLRDHTLRVEGVELGEPGAGGRFEGELARVEGAPPTLRASLVLERLRLRRAGALDAAATGRVTVEGSLAAPRAAGGVQLDDARLQLPEPEAGVMREIRVLGLTDAPPFPGITEGGQPTLFERSALDLSVQIPRNTWVRGRGVTLEVAGELRASKAPRGPLRYTGALQVIRGTCTLYGKRFDLQQGVAVFTGSDELDPLIHVVALHRVRDVSVVATLSGFASSPEIILSSNPRLEETDVLSYLVFGRPSQELAAEQSVDLEAAAAQVVGRLAVNRLSEILSARLPVDTLEAGAAHDGPGTTIGVGKYIGDDVFVRYRHTFGEEQDQEVEIEWRLTPEWSVQSSVSAEGQSGADLIWKRDY